MAPSRRGLDRAAAFLVPCQSEDPVQQRAPKAQGVTWRFTANFAGEIMLNLSLNLKHPETIVFDWLAFMFFLLKPSYEEFGVNTFKYLISGYFWLVQLPFCSVLSSNLLFLPWTNVAEASTKNPRSWMRACRLLRSHLVLFTQL